jgi:hypothetical protein
MRKFAHTARATRGFVNVARLFVVPVLVLGLWPPCAQAQVSRITAQQVVIDTGLSEQLKLMPQQVRTDMASIAPALGLPPELLARMLRAADQAFAPLRLNDLVVTVLARDLHAPRVQEALYWLRSTAGRRVTALELDASAQGIDAQAWLDRGNAAYAAATPQRRALLDAVEQSLQMAEQMAEMQLQTVAALLRGVARALPQQGAKDLGPALAQLQGQRPQLVASARGMALASFAATYAALSDAELGRYLDYLRSPGGEHLNQVLFEALGVAVADASESMGRALPAPPAAQTRQRGQS